VCAETRTSVTLIIVIIGLLSVANIPIRYLQGAGDRSELLDYKMHIQEGGDTYRQVGISILGFGGLIAALRTKNRRTRWAGVSSFLVLAIVVWCLLSITWSVDPPVSARRFLAMSLTLLGALGVVSRWSHADIVKLIAIGTAFFMLSSLLYDIRFGLFDPLSPDYRFGGLFSLNAQGQNCALLTLAAIAASTIVPSSALLYRALSIVGFAVLLLTRSRTSVAALLAGLVVYLYLTLPTEKKWKLGYVTGVLVLLVIVIAIGSLPNILLLGRGMEDTSTLTGRTPLWSECLYQAQPRLLTGFGHGAFWTPEMIEEISYTVGWTVASAHSAYIEIVLNLGLVGVLLYLGALLIVLARAFSCSCALGGPEYALVAGAVVMLLVFGLLESTVILVHSSTGFFITMLIFIVAFGPPKRQVESSTETSDNLERGGHSGP
jgi:O-antigen ligase